MMTRIDTARDCTPVESTDHVEQQRDRRRLAHVREIRNRQPLHWQNVTDNKHAVTDALATN
jgi:hypothetical protein